MIMKEKLEDLLNNEIEDRLNYYLRRLDDPNFKDMQSSYIGHYLELKDIKELIEEILYGEDKELYR